MDDKWFKQQQKRVGVTAGDIAAKMGRSPSAVSHIYSGQRRMSLEWAKVFAEVLQISIDQVLEKAGALDKPDAQTLQTGFAESDAAPWQGTGPTLEKTLGIASYFGGDRPGVDIWTVKENSLALDGLLPGDHFLLDTHQSERCKAGDLVVAQKFDQQLGAAITVLRRYEPPALINSGLPGSDRGILLVDGNNVVIRGKIIASWRSEKADN